MAYCAHAGQEGPAVYKKCSILLFIFDVEVTAIRELISACCSKQCGQSAYIVLINPQRIFALLG